MPFPCASRGRRADRPAKHKGRFGPSCMTKITGRGKRVTTTAAQTAKLPAGEKTYTEAVIRGDYDLYVGNLFGKYDNVRLFWEDQLTRHWLRPHIAALVGQCRSLERGVRIMDLGCGAGQGYELLTKIDKHDLDLSLHHDRVLTSDDMDIYLGLDLSQAMVDKGNELFASMPNVRFRQADLRDGLAAIKDDKASFDIYFSSYGSFSHLSSMHLRKLLVDIWHHGRDGSLVVLDLLGRYSMEWPCYWMLDPEDGDEFLDYSMSYLNTEFGMGVEVDHFPLRFWTGAEVEQLVRGISAEFAGELAVLGKFDRSILVGRHVDTQEYNPNAKPIRRAVNRLHEDYMRTDLERLLVERSSLPQHPDPQVDRLFDQLYEDWNRLIQFCERRLANQVTTVPRENWPAFSVQLQFAMMTMDRVINDTGWMYHGDPRANIIEPQLGYALRSLESGVQKGIGCGHGLVTVLKIRK